MRLKIFILTFFLLIGTKILLAQQILTLEHTLEIAMQNSPNIQSSILNMKRYQETLKANKASLKSQFTLSLNPLNYSKKRSFDEYSSSWYTNESWGSSGRLNVSQPILLTNGTVSLVNDFGWQKSKNLNYPESKAFSNDLYLSVSQPLFTYNKLKVELKEIELNLENSKLAYALKKLEVESAVTQDFYNVYMAQMSLNIAKEEEANTQKSYEIIKNKVDAGLSAMEELYQAELNYSSSQSSVLDARASLEQGKDQLKQYIGMDIYEEITVMADVNAEPVKVDLKKAIDNGLKSRMELRQYGIQVQTSQFDMLSVKADNEFDGSLNFSMGIIGENENISDIYKNPTRNPTVSLSFNIPLIDWGEKKAKIKAQEARMAQTQLSFDDEKISIVVNIRQSYREMENALSQIEIAKQDERNAKLTYDINLERYSNGDLTGMDLNQFQNQLSTKKKNYAQALINYKIQLLNLKIQSMYDFEKQKALLPENLMKVANVKVKDYNYNR